MLIARRFKSLLHEYVFQTPSLHPRLSFPSPLAPRQLIVLRLNPGLNFPPGKAMRLHQTGFVPLHRWNAITYSGYRYSP